MRRVPALVLVACVLATGACASILGIRDVAPEHAFEHRAHALEGIHCLQCHEGVERAGDAGPLNVPAAAACRTCHDKPHDERDCGTCHGLPFVRGAAERARELLRFSHAKHGAVAPQDCVRCHSEAGAGGEVLRPSMAQCVSCHGHDDAFATRNCDACHVDLHTEGSMPEDHLVHGEGFAHDHASAAQRDDGLCATCHAEQFCASCHTGGMMPLVPERLAFDRPSGGGLHRAGFLARHAEESRDAPGLCTTCHAPETCSECHARSRLEADAPGARNPHPPGWVGLPGGRNDHGAAVHRDPASCESCHGGAGEALCVRCHAVGGAGGNPHLRGTTPRGTKLRRPCVQCHEGGR